METLAIKYEQLRKQLTELCFQGQYHYRTYKRLRTLLYEKQSCRNVAELFFDMSVPAHFYTGIGYLCQLYDYHQQSINIFRYLKFVKANVSIFKNANKITILKSLEQDEILLQEIKPLMTNLSVLRNKYYFHLDEQYLKNPMEVFEEYPITYNELERLFDSAGQIINRYSVFYDDSSTHMGIFNEEDIFDLFDFLDLSLNKRRKEWEDKYVTKKSEE